MIPNFADVTSVTQPAGFESVTPMFISESFDQTSLELILRNEVDFVVVDTRLVGQTVRSGAFYEGGAGYGEAAATVTSAMVEKFAEEPGFVLVLDGPVKIYDVRSLRGVPAPFEDRPGPGLPGDVDAVAGRRDRGPARGRPAPAPPGAGPAAVPRRRRVALRPGPPGGDGHRRPRRTPRLRSRRGRGRRRGRALRPGPAEHEPEPLPRRTRSRESWVWGGLVAALVLVTVGLAVWSTYQGLLDFPTLPPPLAGDAS